MYKLKADYEHYANLTLTTSEGDILFDENREVEVSEAVANIFKEINDKFIHVSKIEAKKENKALSVPHDELEGMSLTIIKKIAEKAGLNKSELNGKGKTKEYIISLIKEKELELKY